MIEQTLKSLSANFVLVEPTDLEALSGIRGELDDIVKWAAEKLLENVAETASGASAALEQVIQGNTEEPAAVLEVVGKAIESLQLAVADLGEGAHANRADAGDDSEECSILAEFLSEQDNALDEMEALILALEDGDEETIESTLITLRGKIHTLKGEAGVLALMDVSGLCHALEDTLEERPLPEAASILLDAIDWIRRRFSACESGVEPPAPFEFPAAAQGHGSDNSEQATLPASGTVAPALGNSADQTEPAAESAAQEFETDPVFTEPLALTADPELIQDFVSETGEHLEEADEQLLALDRNPFDDDAINSIFRSFHSIKGLAGFLELLRIQRLSHEAETVLDMARSGQLNIAGKPLAVIFEVTDALKRLTSAVAAAQASGESMSPDPTLPPLMAKLMVIITSKKVPEAQVDSPEAAAEPAPASVAEAESGNALVSAPETTLPKADGAAGKQQPAPQKSTTKQVAKKVKVRETIKVDAERLDELVDTIGELVIAEAMVSQSEELHLEETAHLGGLLTRMDKITRELQEMAMSMRMVPIRSTFRRMARLARDVATKVNKKIDFVTQGDDTELDKTVVDSIGDPLVHLVRNAVDHGIESNAEDREAAGKAPAGRIELRAFHEGGSIHIEIEDDGRGLNAERILAKAIERGIAEEGDKLSESEIYALIFAPGFSTAATLTDVSGRGVGLDVVKRNIEALRGNVDIRSTVGKGSIFSIRLPLTLAIIDGMVIRVGRERFVLPTVSIVRMVTPEEEKMTQVFERTSLLQVGDDLVPMFRIDELFNIPGAIKDVTETSAVVVEQGGRRCALLVDELLGQQQIVIKPLGESLSGARGLAGGAIMPDGQVGLILDIAGMIKLGQSHEPSKVQLPSSNAASTEST